MNAAAVNFHFHGDSMILLKIFFDENQTSLNSNIQNQSTSFNTMAKQVQYFCWIEEC